MKENLRRKNLWYSIRDDKEMLGAAGLQKLTVTRGNMTSKNVG